MEGSGGGGYAREEEQHRPETVDTKKGYRIVSMQEKEQWSDMEKDSETTLKHILRWKFKNFKEKNRME